MQGRKAYSTRQAELCMSTFTSIAQAASSSGGSPMPIAVDLQSATEQDAEDLLLDSRLLTYHVSEVLIKAWGAN